MMEGDTPNPFAGSPRFEPVEKCLVMTGGTSGIGHRVLRKLLSERANWNVILFARPSPRVDALKALPGASGRLAIVNADLASLGSVDRACNEVVSLLGPSPIDALAQGARKTFELSVFTVRMLGRIIVGDASVKNISGPLTLVDVDFKASSLARPKSRTLIWFRLVRKMLAGFMSR